VTRITKDTFGPGNWTSPVEAMCWEGPDPEIQMSLTKCAVPPASVIWADALIRCNAETWDAPADAAKATDPEMARATPNSRTAPLGPGVIM
jgi:hypothetical protein